MLPHALLQQVLRRLDLLGRPHDGDHPLVGALARLVDGDVGPAVQPDLPDPLSTRPDDRPGQVIWNRHLKQSR